MKKSSKTSKSANHVCDELPIPPAASSADAVEMIRLWLAQRKLHCVLNIGFWENRGLDERKAWGILLADMVSHIANAHRSEFGHDPNETIALIRKTFELEMDHPTSARLGEFVKPKQSVEKLRKRPAKKKN